MKHDLFSFLILVSKFERCKGGTFMAGPGRHLASLRHCVRRTKKFSGKVGENFGKISFANPKVCLLLHL